MDGNTNIGGNDGGNDNEPNLFRPDTVITPDRAAATQTVQPTPPPMQQIVPQASTPQEPAQPQMTQPSPQPMPEPTYQQDVPVQYDESPAVDPVAVRWTASEFIAHQKSGSWYALLIIGALVVAGGVWFVTRDMIATATVVIGVLLLAVYAGRKPREETYVLDDYGLTIGNRHYLYEEFRSYAIIPEGAFLSIEFAPLKRFAMYTTIYFDPADQDKIIDILSYHLPMEEARTNLTDSLMRRIHF